MGTHQHKQAHGLDPDPLTPTEVAVVMVPFPAQGHLNQLLQLSRLISSYDIPVHYVGAATHNRQVKQRVHGWDPQSAANIQFHSFEIPPFRCPPPNPNAKTKFPSHLLSAFNAASCLRESISGLLRELCCKARRVVVIHDSVMGSVIQDVRFMSNAESYTFHSVSAFAIYLFALAQMRKPIEADELIPEGTPSLEGCFTAEFYDFIATQREYHKFNSGYVHNTCKLMEGAYMDLLQKKATPRGIKRWAFGPFNPVTVPDRTNSKERHFCLDWLDKQACNSVIYVSFGTTTTMNYEQMRELAVGLKQSNQKFIWVVRDADEGDVFNGQERRGPEIPIGYENSVSGIGLVVRDWAPQLQILAHPATGGFLSHCGWNSCMESITMGVPIATWPMHSDQPRNTILITKLLKIGIVAREWEHRNEIVGAKAVAGAVRRLMASQEGDEVRKRAAELGKSVRLSWDKEGVSASEMESFIAHITR